MFSGRGFLDSGELEIFVLLFMSELFGDVAVEVEFGLAFGGECGKIVLYTDVKLFREFPHRLAGL